VIYVGIDIGLDGALAALSEQGEVLCVSRMPLLKNSHKRNEISSPALASWLLELLDQTGFVAAETRVVMEYVHSFGYESRSSMFSFGRSDGKTRAVLEVLAIPFTDVDPKTWQKALFPSRTKKENTKLAAIEYCEQKWGRFLTQELGIHQLTDGMADALCIAEYGRTIYDWSSIT